MTIKQIANQIAQHVVKPLCYESEMLFKPIHFWPTDCLHVDLDKTGKKFCVEAKNSSGELYVSGEASHDWVKRIPERKATGGYGQWELAATDITALVINAIWTNTKFTPAAQVVYDYLLTKFVTQTQFAKFVMRYPSSPEIVQTEMKRIQHMDRKELPLMLHQRVGLVGCYRKEGFALFMEQGTGKTPIVIARICREARDLKRLYRVLVVCPKNVRTNWRIELDKFATVSGKVTIIRGGQLNRLKQLIEAFQPESGCEWTVVVTSYKTIDVAWSAFKMIEWDLCVLDESHYIKASRTRRWKKIRALRGRCLQRMVLTGTPITNRGPFDLYTQLEFLGEGWSGFTSFAKYRQFYSKFIRRNGDGTLKQIGFTNLPLIQERLTRCSFMATKAEVLPDLPEKTWDVWEVEMTSEQICIYRTIRDKLYLEIKNDLDMAQNKELVIRNVLVKLLRLAQVTSGFVVFNAILDVEGDEVQPRSIDRIDPNPKIDALIEILREKPKNSKTGIWACWTQDIKTIAARLAEEKIGCVTLYGNTRDEARQIAIDRFNADPSCDVFLGNPAAGGVGINLQESGCDHVIYYSQNWSMVARTQSEDRFHRMGTKCAVRYTDLCVPGTIDEEIRTRVLQTRVAAVEIQDVRQILARLAEFEK